MKKLILKSIVKGALLVFPVVITVWLLWTMVTWIDGLGRKALEPFLLDHIIFPGSGLIIVFLSLLLIGLLFQFSFFKYVFVKLEKNFLKFPLVNTLYSAIKDLANMFDSKNENQQVVMVDLSSLGLGSMIGILTNNDMSGFNHIESMHREESSDSHIVAVYLPMSYMVGGFTILIEKKQLTEIDMPFEEAMRFALTAGVSKTTKVTEAEPGK